MAKITMELSQFFVVVLRFFQDISALGLLLDYFWLLEDGSRLLRRLTHQILLIKRSKS